MSVFSGFLGEEEEEEEEELPDHEESIHSTAPELSNSIAVPVSEFTGELGLAVLLLSRLERFRELEILRTDDPEVYPECAMRLCVGDEYDPEGLTCPRRAELSVPGLPPTVSLSTLLFHHFGAEAFQEQLQDVPEEDAPFMMKMIYTHIFAGLDSDGDCDIRRLARTIDPQDDPDTFVKKELFTELVDHISELVEQKVTWIKRKLLPGRQIVRKALGDRKKVSPNGEILLIPHYVPLDLHKDLISAEDGKKGAIKYIVMQRVVGDWGVYALKWKPNFRKLKFAGLREEHLNSVLQGITGQGWIHPDGTIGAWSGQWCAIEYLKQILKQSEKQQFS